MTNSGRDSNAEMEKKISELMPKDRVRCFDFPRPSGDIIGRYLQIEDITPTVSDILDQKGIHGAIPRSVLQPIISEKRIAGPAVTIRHIPERKTVVQNLIDKEKAKHAWGELYIREIAKSGDVLVYDGGGRLDISGQGSIAALSAKVCGLAGSILDCGVRDVEGIRKIDYPTWARGITPITCKHRFEAYEINCPVVCAGILVYPGDLIIADECGVVIVPSSFIEEVLVDAEYADKKEKQLKEAIYKGLTSEELAKILPPDKW